MRDNPLGPLPSTHKPPSAGRPGRADARNDAVAQARQPHPRSVAAREALGRYFSRARTAALTRALAGWRLALSHALRHTSLLRLQKAQQAQQSQLQALRRSIHEAPAPKPGHPSASLVGSSLRDSLLLRLAKSRQLLRLSSALCGWRVAMRAIGRGGGGGPGGIKTTAPRALKRANAQEKVQA